MRPAAFITGIAGMAMVVVLLLAGQARLHGGDGSVPDTDASGAATKLPDANADMAKPPATLTDEDATADETAQNAPVATETPSATPEGKDSVELLRPTVENAGVLSFGKRRLQIVGVIATPADKSCGSEGREWPCGMMAKTALRLFLRNRTIDCDLPSDAWQDMARTACRLGQQDIGTWLVENGWAEAQPGSPLAAAGQKAKQAKKGIHGEDPRRRPAAAPRPEPANPL